MWKVEPDQGMFAVIGEKKYWAANEADANWLVEVLDAATNTVYKLFCQNKQCNGFDGYITRAAEEAKKTVYSCDECGKPMVRKIPGTPGAIASEKPTVAIAHGNFPGVAEQRITNPVKTQQHADSAGMARSGGAVNNNPNLAGIRAGVGPKRNTVDLDQITALLQGGKTEVEIPHVVGKGPELQPNLPDWVEEMRGRLHSLEERTSKLESEGVAQAETFQVVMTSLEEFMATKSAQNPQT